MSTTTRTLKIIVNQSGNALGGLSKIKGALGTVATVAGGAALGGVVALAGGIGAAGVAGLSMNNSMEQAQARINAFTKDAGKTTEILEMVRDRAAKTPFAFNDMATAAAALLPSAKQAQTGLEDLIGQAEILAASNPAEGLEGAAFALKEAVSGDFTSIIERFNLPRQFINQLKEEGVPNLEIVQRAMQELGLDTDLVSALANTAEGRWSTFKDTLQNLASTVTQPLFDTVSGSLGGLNTTLEANAPKLQAFAEMLSGKVQSGLDWLAGLIPRLVEVWDEWSGRIAETTDQALPLITDALQRLSDVFGISSEGVSAADVVVAIFTATLQAVDTAIKLAAITLQGIALAVEKVSEAINIGKGLWDNLKIIVTHAVDEIKNKWNEVRGQVQSGIDGWRSAFNNVRSAIGGVVSRFYSMASAARSAIDSIPDWLIPGSPTPFEIGLRGIAAAAGKVNKALPAAFNGNNLAGGGPVLAGAAGGGGGVTVQVAYSPLVSTADSIEIETKLVPKIIEGLRKAGVKISG